MLGGHSHDPKLFFFPHGLRTVTLRGRILINSQTWRFVVLITLNRRERSACLFWAFTSLLCIAHGGPSFAQEPLPDTLYQSEVRFSGEAPRPDTVIWSTDEKMAVFGRSQESEDSIKLDAKRGCLAQFKNGYQPIVMELDLSPGKTIVLEQVDWVRGVEVVGRVLNMTHEPLIATVVLEPRPIQRSDDPVQRDLQESKNLCNSALRFAGITQTVTDGEGHFEIGPLPTGTHIMNISAKNHSTLSKKTVIELNCERINVGDFLLREIGRLVLKFDLSRIKETPPFDVSIQVENPEGWVEQQYEWVEIEKRKTNAIDPIDFTLGTGLHRVIFTKEGSEIFVIHPVFIAPGLNVALIRPTPITVSGKVFDKEGPVEAAGIEAACQGSLASAVADDDGLYELDVWNAVACAVFVAAPDGRRFAEKLDLRLVELGDEVEMDLEFPRSSVAGIVVDAESGEPLPNSELSLMQWTAGTGIQTAFVTSSDEEGRFEFRGAKGGGEVERTRLTASMDGYMPETIDVDVPDAGSTDEYLRLHESVQISGRVVGPAGEPVIGAIVGCCSDYPGGNLTVSANTNMAGDFTLDTSHGSVIFAAASAYSLGWSQALDTDQETLIRLGARANSIKLRVVNSEGDPIPGVALSYSTPETGILPLDLLLKDAALNHQFIRSNDEGYLTTTALPPRVYRIWLLSATNPRELGTVAAPSWGEVTLQLP